MSRRYTEREDALILAADELCGVPDLARNLGRSQVAVGRRRAELLGRSQNGGKSRKQRSEQAAGRRESRGLGTESSSRFARPAWFDEDLRQMTKGGV